MITATRTGSMMTAAEVGELTRRYAVLDSTITTYESRNQHWAANPDWLAGVSDTELGEIVLGDVDRRLSALSRNV